MFDLLFVRLFFCFVGFFPLNFVINSEPIRGIIKRIFSDFVIVVVDGDVTAVALLLRLGLRWSRGWGLRMEKGRGRRSPNGSENKPKAKR